jgi:uncharacterized protein YwgA
MFPYHLAKLVDWAGELKSRKRLQKVVYLLQASGCKALDADFILHHYGPYSPEVASLADQMVASGLLQEAAAPNNVGVTYSYGLTESAKSAIQATEHGPQGGALAASLRAFEGRARTLLKSDLHDLEYGATIVYFYRQSKDWTDAVSKACAFKKLQPDSAPVARALKLAKEIFN